MEEERVTDGAHTSPLPAHATRSFLYMCVPTCAVRVTTNLVKETANCSRVNRRIVHRDQCFIALVGGLCSPKEFLFLLKKRLRDDRKGFERAFAVLIQRHHRHRNLGAGFVSRRSERCHLHAAGAIGGVVEAREDEAYECRLHHLPLFLSLQIDVRRPDGNVRMRMVPSHYSEWPARLCS